MNETPYVHIGVVVPELEPAIAAYGRLGLTFMEPRVVHVDRLVEDGRETEIDLRIVFSHQGPPQLELLEATGDGIYGLQHAGGIHHVAVLDPDPASRSERLVAAGLNQVGAQFRPDDSMIVAYLEGLPGVRVELLDASVQDAIDAWVRGEDAAP